MIATVREPCDENMIRAVPASAPCGASARKWVLAATILGSSMAFIDGTVVNVALPALQKELQATIADVQWVIEAYALLLSALLLVGGSLGDRFGRRRIYLLGVTIFAAASVECGFAANVVQLIVARAVQGFGAALLVPGSLAIISSSFREEERGRAIGTWSGFSAITAAIGPVFGGWLIDHFSWRAAFFVNVPLALAVIALSLWQVPESRGAGKGRLDWAGAFLIAAALGALVYALIEAPQRGFRNPVVLTSLLLGGIGLVLFLLVERRVADPMLPLALFRSRTFSGANLLTLLLYFALGGTLFFLPLNLIQVQHYSPTAAGAALLPFILIMFLLSRWSGGLVERYGAKIPLVVGPLIAAAGFALFVFPGIGGAYWRTFFPPLIVLGLGMAVTVAPLTTTVMNSVAAERAGAASGINNAVSRTGGLIAIAVLGILMLRGFDRALDLRIPQMGLTEASQQTLQSERGRMAGADLSSIPERTRPSVVRAINESFVVGFREVMLVGAALAVASSMVAAGAIDGKKISPGH